MKVLEALKKINDYESKLSAIQLSNADNLSVSFSNKQMIINLGNQNYSNPYGRNLKSILELNSIYTAGNNLENDIRNEEHEEMSDMALSLKKSNSILLVDKQENTFYGIISPTFTKIDPLYFREKLIESFQALRIKPSIKTDFTPFKEVRECFEIHTGIFEMEEPVQYDFSIIYGKNNGLSSYRVEFGRTILVCKNGMTKREVHKLQLKHTSNANIDTFFTSIQSSLQEFNSIFQSNINNAKASILNKDMSDEFFQRIHLSTAVKNRIKQRFQVEERLTGNTLWSLSQAMTNLATHFYEPSYDNYHTNVLRNIGSDIIDFGFDKVMSRDEKLVFFRDLRCYGKILPKSYFSEN